MKYGLLARHEWVPENAGYPENTFCIVLLMQTGAIARDKVFSESSGQDVGYGRVYSYTAQGVVSEGYVMIPMDAVVYGAHDTEDAAIAYAINEYQNDIRELEKKINEEIENNQFLDIYIHNSLYDQRFMRAVWIAVVLCGIILGVFAVVLLRRYYGIAPLFH